MIEVKFSVVLYCVASFLLVIFTLVQGGFWAGVLVLGLLLLVAAAFARAKESRW